MGLLIAILSWVGVRELLNWNYDATDSNSSQINLILLSHIAAHVQGGTELEESEASYLDSLLPMNEWEYDCCYIGNISYNPAFKRQTFLSNFSKNLSLAIKLFLRDPLIDIRHQLCSSEINWVFIDNRCSFKSLHAFDSVTIGQERWIASNDYGLRENSLLPILTPIFMQWFDNLGLFTGKPIFLIKPAFYFYLTLIMIGAGCMHRNDQKILSLLLPSVLQTFVLSLIIFAPSFRYQYGICLIGLVSLGLPFLPAKKD